VSERKEVGRESVLGLAFGLGLNLIVVHLNSTVIGNLSHKTTLNVGKELETTNRLSTV
jgi:hypothetical protein